MLPSYRSMTMRDHTVSDYLFPSTGSLTPSYSGNLDNINIPSPEDNMMGNPSVTLFPLEGFPSPPQLDFTLQNNMTIKCEPPEKSATYFDNDDLNIIDSCLKGWDDEFINNFEDNILRTYGDDLVEFPNTNPSEVKNTNSSLNSGVGSDEDFKLKQYSQPSGLFPCLTSRLNNPTTSDALEDFYSAAQGNYTFVKTEPDRTDSPITALSASENLQPKALWPTQDSKRGQSRGLVASGINYQVNNGRTLKGENPPPAVLSKMETNTQQSEKLTAARSRLQMALQRAKAKEPSGIRYVNGKAFPVLLVQNALSKKCAKVAAERRESPGKSDAVQHGATRQKQGGTGKVKENKNPKRGRAIAVKAYQGSIGNRMGDITYSNGPLLEQEGNVAKRRRLEPAAGRLVGAEMNAVGVLNGSDAKRVSNYHVEKKAGCKLIFKKVGKTRNQNH